MVTAFSPGHITCFFAPSGPSEGNALSRGSVGAGIRTSLGATVEICERSGSGHRIVMDGVSASASVTEKLLERMAPGRGFEVFIENQLPCSEGFGMSAAGAIAAALCLSEIVGTSEQQAYEQAHLAEINGGGGLGDVSAISCLEHQPVRIRPGIPPYGEVIGTGVEFRSLSFVVLGPKMHTGQTLGNPEVFSKISEYGKIGLNEYLEDPSEDALFGISNRFSSVCGLESDEVKNAIHRLNENGFRSAMCMLGNSIFTDAPPEEARSILGVDKVYSASSTNGCPSIIRKE